MLDRLLESKATTHRSVTGAAASVATHSALLGLALYATAHAGVETSRPRQIVRPVYFAPARPPAAANPALTSIPTIVRNRLVFVDPAIKLSLPSIDLPAPAGGLGDFRRDPIGASTSLGTAGLGPDGTDATFRADQVEKQVSVISGNASPRYPEVLRMAGVEGQVVARFVVDERGRVEEGTIKLVRSDNPLFDDPVRSALARMRFSPAETGGRKVRQLVEMPFVFSLSR